MFAGMKAIKSTPVLVTACLIALIVTTRKKLN